MKNSTGEFTHIIKASRQKCRRAVWFPTKHKEEYEREKQYPLMALESGQVTRVNANNLEKIK